MFHISFCLFFFKQKTAYEMRISDWSSDVCSSDLNGEQAEFIIARTAADKAGAVGIGVERAGRIVARALQHRSDAPIPRIGGDIAAVLGEIGAHGEIDVELFAVGDRLGRVLITVAVDQIAQRPIVVVMLIEAVLTIDADAVKILAQDESNQARNGVRPVNRRSARTEKGQG